MNDFFIFLKIWLIVSCLNARTDCSEKKKRNSFQGKKKKICLCFWEKQTKNFPDNVCFLFMSHFWRNVVQKKAWLWWNISCISLKIQNFDKYHINQLFMFRTKCIHWSWCVINGKNRKNQNRRKLSNFAFKWLSNFLQIHDNCSIIYYYVLFKL